MQNPESGKNTPITSYLNNNNNHDENITEEEEKDTSIKKTIQEAVCLKSNV